MNRRGFLRRAAAASAMSAAAQNAGAAVSANDKIGVGIIGCGGMGRMDLADFQKQPEVEIRAVCDVFRPAVEQARGMTVNRADAYSDFRRVLDRKDIDIGKVAGVQWDPQRELQRVNLPLSGVSRIYCSTGNAH